MTNSGQRKETEESRQDYYSAKAHVTEIKKLLYSLVRVLSTAIDERTPYNAAHTKNMVRYGRKFVDFLNRKGILEGTGTVFSEEKREEFLLSIWLHDIGKLTTPLSVMDKQERLLPEDKQAIQYRLREIALISRIRFLEGTITDDDLENILIEVAEAGNLVERTSATGMPAQRDLQAVEYFGRKTYTDENGNRHFWLTEREVKALSIQTGTLTEEEREIMKDHVSVTEKLLSQVRFSDEYSQVVFWASSHHEYLDGSGYPRGLSGDQIPKEVRMITILDIFEALTAVDRPYKTGIPVEDALLVLEEMADSGGKLDKKMVALFRESRCWE